MIKLVSRAGLCRVLSPSPHYAGCGIPICMVANKSKFYALSDLSSTAPSQLGTRLSNQHSPTGQPFSDTPTTTTNPIENPTNNGHPGGYNVPPNPTPRLQVRKIEAPHPSVSPLPIKLRISALPPPRFQALLDLDVHRGVPNVSRDSASSGPFSPVLT
jgi:hypothetical protein